MRTLFAFAVLASATSASAQVVSNDGSFGYSYTFTLPPARGKYQPTLRLSYRSGGGATGYGVGWSLSMNYIDASQRATLTTSGSVRVRYTLARDGTSQLMAAADDGSYRPDVSGAYFKVTPVGSLPYPTSWTAVDSVGNVYTYSCIATTVCDRWYLTSVVDTDSNATYLDYSVAEPVICPTGFSTTVALLTGIRYNQSPTAPTTSIHRITLSYQSLDDYASTHGTSPATPVSEAIDNCFVTHDHVLTAISVLRAGPTSVYSLGSWSMSYSSSRDTSRARLDSIQVYDRANTALGIPTSFTYETDLTPANTVTQFDSGAIFSFGATADSSLINPTISQCGAWIGFYHSADTPCRIHELAVFVDVDGDGLPDMVWGGTDPAATGAQPGLRWARNVSRPANSGAPTFSAISVIPGSTSWPGALSAVYGDGSTTTTAGAMTTTNTLFMDMNGDGVPDLVTSGTGPEACGDPNVVTAVNPNVFIGVRFFQPSTGTYSATVCYNAGNALSSFRSLYNSTALYMPLVYSQRGPGINNTSPIPTYTWVQLLDLTGDGIPDFVIVDRPNSVWYVYPGYRGSGGWAFAQPYTMHPTFVGQNTAGLPIRAAFGALYGTTLGGEVGVDIRDVNGDGLPDRVIFQTYTDASNIPHRSWFVEYNTGTDFVRVASAGLPIGMYQLDVPNIALPRAESDGYVSSNDTALVDLNRDGRPDFVGRTTGCPSGSQEAIVVFYNSGAGVKAVSSAYPYGVCLANPTGYVPFEPSASFETADHCTGCAPVNEGLIDLDGDGITDYVRDAVESGVNQWSYHRGHHQSRRSDILTSLTSSSGLSLIVHWAPSSNYGVRPGLPFVSDVVASMDQSGPAMDPLTTTYMYATPQVTTVWDDPTQSLQEPLGFAQRLDTPSVGGFTLQSVFGSTHATAGMVTQVCRGTSATPCSATSAPGISDKTTFSWLMSSIPSGCGSSGCYPAYRYLDSRNRYRTELVNTPIATESNSAPDAYGNIVTSTLTADALDTNSASSVRITRAYATGAGSQCVSCLVEETIADPVSLSDLSHTYVHYDLPSGQTNNGRNPSIVLYGHISYLEALVSGNGATGQYEVASISYYSDGSGGSPKGALTSVVKYYPYPSPGTTAVTQSLTYDSFSGIEITSARSSDGTTTLTTTNQWDAYGGLIEQDGPSVSLTPTPPGWSAPPAARLARAYDAAGRLVAISEESIVGGVVTKPVAAFEYTTPTPSAPAVVTTYTFGRGSNESVSFPVTGPVPQTDDATRSLSYYDALGRLVQVRSRLGSGVAGSSANVVKNLPQQYAVRSNIVLDGLGRVTASLDPYFSTAAAYVDPRGSAELSTAGLHATVISYDAESRPLCKVYEPLVGSIVAAPADPSLCFSNYPEGSAYRRATRTTYGTSSLNGRLYMTVDTVANWAASTSNPGRLYNDAVGRVRYARAPSNTVYEQTSYDQLSRRLSIVRYAAVPGTPGTPTVVSSWTYDKRGRVVSEFADASGSRFYSYLATGDLSQVTQNATQTTAAPNAVWSVNVFGTLGRVVERDDFRWETDAVCGSQAHEDTITYSYDTGQTPGRYGFTAGRVASIASGGTTVAIGYDNLGRPVVRDEWTGDNLGAHSVADSIGADGRLLSRTMTSSYLLGYNSGGVFGYAVGYDSAGHPLQVNPTYDSAGVIHSVTASAAPSAYWLAGTGSSDPTTGPYDAFGRLISERWDSGTVTKSRSFLAGSNLTGSFSTLLSSGTNVYTSQSMVWQGTLIGGYTVTSAAEGSGTSYAAAYDADAHLQQWSAAPLNTLGLASQQFNEAYAFSLENLATVNATNSIGANVASTYHYDDTTSKERVTSITAPSSPVTDTYSYDRRGRGLITQHRLTSTQNPAQESYEYDSLNRLISVSYHGSKKEDLAYDGGGDLVSRRFTNGSDVARYYVGEDLSLVIRNSTTKIGYVHIRLGAQRIASFWVKSTGTANTTGIIYYHRNERGDVVATTTSGGQMGISYRYLPSGAVDKTVGTEADENTSEIGFIGGLKLSNGLVHLRARAYSPALRRFLQPDTVDVRRYSYAHGDALNFADPSGRADDRPAAGVGTLCTAGDNCSIVFVHPSEETLRALLRIEDPDATVGWWSTTTRGGELTSRVFIPNPAYQEFVGAITASSLMANGGGAGFGSNSNGGVSQSRPDNNSRNSARSLLASILVPLGNLRVPIWKAALEGKELAKLANSIKLLSEGSPPPPIDVSEMSTGEYYINNGVSRAVAAREAGLLSIEAEVTGVGAGSASVPLGQVVFGALNNYLSIAAGLIVVNPAALLPPTQIDPNL